MKQINIACLRVWYPENNTTSPIRYSCKNKIKNLNLIKKEKIKQNLTEGCSVKTNDVELQKYGNAMKEIKINK